MVPVKAISQNPRFDYFEIDYDISVLLLSEELTFGDNVAAINLPELNQAVEAGTVVNVTGWGVTEEGGGELAENLQVVQVSVVSNEDCAAAYGDDNITDRMLCAGVPEGGKDSCQGDSGGPLSANNTLLGIVSWGYGCAEQGYPGVYSNVTSLRDYVTDVTGL